MASSTVNSSSALSRSTEADRASPGPPDARDADVVADEHAGDIGGPRAR
jgi:hypothetical protein